MYPRGEDVWRHVDRTESVDILSQTGTHPGKRSRLPQCGHRPMFLGADQQEAYPFVPQQRRDERRKRGIDLLEGHPFLPGCKEETRHGGKPQYEALRTFTEQERQELQRVVKYE